jgi:hypothetical protein
MEVSYDYHKIMAIVRGTTNFHFHCETWLILLNQINRLHHDQQTAHALESAAAAYSNYPMTGMRNILSLL